jgi:hypothetical protein
MKSNMTRVRTLLAKGWKPALLAIAVLGFAAGSTVLAGRGNAGNAGVMPPQSHPNGKSYAEWGAAWWQWALALPAEINPILDTTGASCGLGQSGPVWFLAGTSGASVERICTVPRDKAIFFPIINVLSDYPCPPEFGFEPTEGQTMEDFLTQNANMYIGNVTNLGVEVDGVALKNLYDYRATSSLYYFTADTSLTAVLDPCITGTPQPGVADGYWIMLTPLKRGTHTIHFTGACWIPEWNWGFTVNVTYLLTVQ